MMKTTKRSLLWLGAPVLLVSLGAAGMNLINHSERVLVPAGTVVEVRQDRAVTTKQNYSGDVFKATVVEPVNVDGKAVIPEGSTATGRVVYAGESGRLKGTARLQLALESVEVGGQEYDFQTSTSVRGGGSHKKRNWAFIGGGGAAAALIGKKEIVLPAETRLRFQLAKAAEIEVRS